MQPFLAAIVYWVGLAAFIAIPTWISSPPAQPTPIRVFYACPQGYVCFPAKDQSRVAASSGLPPNVFADARSVATQPFRRAADITPQAQATETHTKKRGRR